MKKTQVINVWDPFIRIFHWSLVIAFSISWLSQVENYNLHLQAGYATLGLIISRILWGLIGSKHARFSDFVYSPRTIITYLKSLTGKHSKRYIGHNPAGGVMVLLLLTGLLIVTISGIALDGAENWSGPMSDLNLFQHKSLIQSIHILTTNSLLILIALHLAGTAYSSILHKENLVSAMITGEKQANK